MPQIDVLIITALKEEYDAAYEAAKATLAQGYGISAWEDSDTDEPTPYAFGTYVAPNKLNTTVALARPTRMGSTATGSVASSLVERLKPRCLAMCGVCAGNPADVALGDVIIAEMAYQYDEGKQTPEGFQGDHRQSPLSDTWVRTAQDLSPEGLPSFGEPSEYEAKNWLLERLRAGDNPRTYPSRARYFPGDTWRNRIQALEQEGLVRRDGQELTLTELGRSFVDETLFYDVEGPAKLPFQIKVGPIASGNVVIKDGLTWDKLKQWGVRSVLGLDMEAATIGSVAHHLGVQQWLVVKGVMDHADPRKDDRYKPFAARASAEVLFKFLSQQLIKQNDWVLASKHKVKLAQHEESTAWGSDHLTSNATSDGKEYWIYALISKREGRLHQVFGFFEIEHLVDDIIKASGRAFWIAPDGKVSFRGNWYTDRMPLAEDRIYLIYYMEGSDHPVEKPSRHAGYINLTLAREPPMRGDKYYTGYIQDHDDWHDNHPVILAERLAAHEASWEAALKCVLNEGKRLFDLFVDRAHVEV